MCLAIPGLIESIHGRIAIVDFGGVKREAVIDLMEPGSMKPGTYVIVHTGFVIQILDKNEAEATLEIWKDILKNVDPNGII
jgi:hydrogenase expression/formation protein HypC